MNGGSAVFTDDGLVPLPVISLAVSLIALLIHWGLAVCIAELRSLYGRYVMTLLTLHLAGNFLQLLAGGIERLRSGPASSYSVALAVSGAGSHLCQLFAAAFSLASAMTLWREERRQARRQALIRVLSCRRFARCLAACALLACLLVSAGLLADFYSERARQQSRKSNATLPWPAGNVSSPTRWNFVEPTLRMLDPGYARVSLIFVYRDRNCSYSTSAAAAAASSAGSAMPATTTAAPSVSPPGAAKPKAIAAYACLLAGPALLLYALHLWPLLQLGRIVDSMVEERRLSNRTRASVNSFLLLSKFAVSSGIVWLSALLSLLLNPACDGLCLWYAYYMLHALQSIFLCISCLFARAPIEILMRRFARKRDEAKLESGLSLLAAVMHSKRKNKSIRRGGGPSRWHQQRAAAPAAAAAAAATETVPETDEDVTSAV